MLLLTMTTCAIVSVSAVSSQNLWASYLEGARTGQIVAVRSALQSGRVDVDFAFEEDGMTALMYASLAGHDAVVDAILEAGAQVDLANNEGETALILASKYGFTDVAARLIEAGADPNVRDASERTAWTWARWGENARLLSLLEASGTDPGGKTDPFDPGAPVDRYEKLPAMTRYGAPKVPDELEKRPVDGTLTIQLVVTRDGRPAEIELIGGLHEELDENALEAAEEVEIRSR